MIKNIADLPDSFKTRVAVVGSGAAGSVIAYKLASAEVDCLVLEAGAQFDRRALAQKPSRVTRDVYRESAFFSAIGKPIIPIPLGQCLGGTTVINSGTCFRTPQEKIDVWRNVYGLTSLTQEAFASSGEFIEKLIGVETASYDRMSRGNLKFRDGLEKLGLHGKPLLRNTTNCEGCGYCCYGCPSRAKNSMDVSVIPKAVHAGAQFVVQAPVTKIERKGARVTALVVEYKDSVGKKQKKKVFADYFILSGGTIFSAALLLKNGFNFPALGKNLTIHPTTKVLALFEERLDAWKGIPQAYSYEGLKKEGMTFEGVFLPPDVVGATLPYHSEYEVIMENYDKVAAFGALIHDSGSGSVRHFPLLGTKAFYSLTTEDVRKFQKAIAFMARVYLAAGAKKVYPFINRQGLTITCEKDVARFESLALKNIDIESMGFHPLGTCRMGLGPRDSVIDQNYRVHGMKNLYVCDGSVVPSNLGVNPQITIMSFANQMADALLKSL